MEKRTVELLSFWLPIFLEVNPIEFNKFDLFMCEFSKMQNYVHYFPIVLC